MSYYFSDEVELLCNKLYAYASLPESLDLLCDNHNGEFTFSVSDNGVTHDVLYINSFGRFIFFRSPEPLRLFFYNAHEAAEMIFETIKDLKDRNKLKDWVVVLSSSSEKSWLSTDYEQVKLIKSLTEFD